MAVPELLAGCAAGDITPDPGICMGGYWGRKSGARGVHDRLAAKTVVWSQGERRAALVALDLIGLDASTVARIRTRVEERSGIPAQALMICCSHTHSGPLTLPLRGMGAVDAGYLGRMEEEVASIVELACSDLKPVLMAHCKVPVQVGCNRRRRSSRGDSGPGPVADYAHLVRIDAEDGLALTLCSHACHPTVLGRANHRISADFVGAALGWIEARTRRPALFVNGACGDINPKVRRRGHGNFDDVAAAGQELGKAVVAGLETAEELKAADIDWALEKVQLPLVNPPPRMRVEGEKLFRQLRAWLKRQSGSDPWEQMASRARLEWAREMLELARSGAGDRRQPFEIQVLRLGPLALLGMEGEIFARYQLDLEARSPLQPTILCGYANGCIGYVPTADEYPRGGYEIEEAFKVYGSVQMIAPESEELIREGAAELLGRLVGN